MFARTLAAALLIGACVTLASSCGGGGGGSSRGGTPPVPTAPSGLIVTVVSQTRIDLAWTDNSNDETGFKVERSLAGAGAFTLVGTTLANVTTFSDTTVVAATSYDYRVRATNGNGDSVPSTGASGTTPPNPTAPAAPSGLSASAASQTEVNLDWTDNSNNETGFKVERRVGASGAFVQIGTTQANTTTFDDLTVIAGTTYQYQVRATGAGGDSAASNVATATTPPNPPAAPTNLTATPASPTQVNLTWTDNATNETGFEVQRALGPSGGTFAQIGTSGADATSFSDTTASAGTTYRYRVRATNSAGNSAFSNVATATTPSSNAPVAPSNLVATGVSKTRIDLFWTDNSANETGFKLERSLFGANAFTEIATLGPNATSAQDTNVIAGESYEYRVRATNASGDSAFSNVAQGVTLYDIVYVRYPKPGGSTTVVTLPDGENPYAIDDGADLMLLHPDGTEEVLVDCGTTSSVQDPTISYDGRTVYYAKYTNMDLSNGWHNDSSGRCFIYKMQLRDAQGNDIPAAQRQEIQLTSLGSGFATFKLAGNTSADDIDDFNIRDLGPTPLPDGRILFTSNREGIIAFLQGTRNDVSAVGASSASQLFIMDDHDGSTPNKNLQLIGYSNLHQAQHPIILKDGRVLFTNWDDAGLRDNYGMATLYTCDQRGSNINQFLEPHNYHKRVDHFAAQLTSGHVVVIDYYPFMQLWGFGIVHRYEIDRPLPQFFSDDQTSEDDFRFFSRKGLTNMTPHTNGEHTAAPNDSGRYSTPAAAPKQRLYVAYSPGKVAHDAPDGSTTTNFALDSGIYYIENASTAVLTSPSSLVMVRQSSSFNEMWPRPVVSYRAIHGVDAPATTHPDNGLSPTPRDRGLVPGSPIAIVGSSSIHNRESEHQGFNDGFTINNGREQAPAFGVQGTDVGVVTPSDVFGIRVVIVSPDRYHDPYDTTSVERNLLPDSRYDRHVKGYASHTDENWKILGEFSVLNAGGVADPSGAPDTSFLTRIPANTPFFLQGIDSRGMTLFTEQTWRHATPGSTVADCGGCHAHSIAPVAWTGKAADQAGYTIVDLVNSSPLVESGAVQNRAQTGAWGVEFRRDVYPILRNRCASCHTGSKASLSTTSRLSMFETTPPASPTLSQALRTFNAVARDSSQNFTSGAFPSGISSYTFPQVSRYTRAIQARASLLSWRLYNQRLDGRTNGSRSDDLDFAAAVNCTAHTVTTAEEKGTITRWIDLGCHIDLDDSPGAPRPKNRYTEDNLVPLLTVNLFEQPNDEIQLRVGMLDVESGIDTASLQVSIQVPGGATITKTFADLSFNPTTHVGITTLGALRASQFSNQSPLHVSAEVSDVAGNSERIDRFVGTVAPAP